METGLSSLRAAAGKSGARFSAETAEGGMKPDQAKQYSPLVLAYLGDAVFELMIRERVVGGGNAPVNRLHAKSSGLVKAGTQARLLAVIEPELSEEERAVYKRGRNAKSLSVAKHATVHDYRVATGFETLAGYLYLSGRYERLAQLVERGLAGLESEAENAKAERGPAQLPR